MIDHFKQISIGTTGSALTILFSHVDIILSVLVAAVTIFTVIRRHLIEMKIRKLELRKAEKEIQASKNSGGSKTLVG